MGALHIRLFGTVRVTHEGGSHNAQLSHAMQLLLAWLLLHRRTHARETLAAFFWCDQRESRARSCLNTALWRLRQVLEPDGVPRGTYLISEPAAVGFNCASNHWLDVVAFEEGVGRLAARGTVNDASDRSRAETAIAHYTGDLLEGFYDDWALRERERLRILYLDTLGILLRHYSGAGTLEEALRCGQRILAVDPLREEIHREVIRLQVRSGHRALALQQYDSCRATLREELGIEPMEETRALYADLLGGTPRVTRTQNAPSLAASATGPSAKSPRTRLAPSLRAAAASLEDVRKAIIDALHVAESDPDNS